MKILSKAERDAALKKRAEEATQRANQSPAGEKKKNAAFEKVKTSLQKMGYEIKDEEGLKEIIGSDNSLKYDKISILAQRGIISLSEQELDKSRPKAPVVFSISEADISSPQKQQMQAPAPQPQAKETMSPSKQETQARIRQIAEQKKQKEQQPSKEAAPTNPSENKTDVKPTKTSVENEIKNNDAAPKKSDKLIEPPKLSAFEKKYAKSLETWCQKTTDKKTGKVKREIKSVQQNIINSEEETQINIAPLSPIAAKQGDNGAVYKIKKGTKPNQTDVTLGSSEPGKPLNYDYFYSLVKAAHDSGADTIEFKDIKTPEFRDKLLAAALQFKMKLKNPPGAINLAAPHLQTIPPGCRHYLELHNESVKKALQKMGKQIIPEKGTKFSTGPKAEERTHAEKVFIESELAQLKAKKAEQARIAMEQRLNSPSSEDYDQHPEKYIKNQRNNPKQKRKFSPTKGNTR